MVDRTDPPPVSRQFKLLDPQRLTFYCQSKAVPGADLALMRTMANGSISEAEPKQEKPDPKGLHLSVEGIGD